MQDRSLVAKMIWAYSSLSSRHSLLRALEHFSRYDEPLYFRGALAYLREAHVAVVALHVGLGDVAETAMHLDGFVAALLPHLGREELGHGGLLGEGILAVLQPGRLVHQLPGRLQLHSHIRKHELHRLE